MGAILRKNRQVKYTDPSHPCAKEKMTGDMLCFRNRGCDMIKHDFAGADTFDGEKEFNRD